MRFSASIITFNAGSTLERCLDSLKGIVDEIVVVDSYSTDNTKEICERFGAVFIQNEFTGFKDQRNYALQFVSCQYALTLDADEVLSGELRESLLKVKENPEADVYFISRLNNFCGQWIRHSGMYPDRHIRLYNIGMGEWGPNNVHENFMPVPGAKIGYLEGDILHYACNTVKEYTDRVDAYTERYAREYHKNGKKVSFLAPALHGAWRFFRNYILRMGFLDGKNGFIVCGIGAKSSYRKYKRLRQLNRENRVKLKSGNKG